MSKSEEILTAARQRAQAHGYGGLNFRDLANDVGIKAASIYHHFPSKADLGAAVARRYWEDAAANLNSIGDEEADPGAALRRYPEVFRRSLESENRLCLASFMSAENDDLPELVKAGWGEPMPKGQGRGIALATGWGSRCAMVVEVAVEGKALSVRRVVCAFDCGQQIAPDNIVSQLEGAAIFGLSAALFG